MPEDNSNLNTAAAAHVAAYPSRRAPGDTRPPYEKPSIKRLGSVHGLTLGGGSATTDNGGSNPGPAKPV